MFGGFDVSTFDILKFGETWLNHSIDESEIALPGFNCVRGDRVGEKNGLGGVAAGLKLFWRNVVQF